jgi:hypothetical protein
VGAAAAGGVNTSWVTEGDGESWLLVGGETISGGTQGQRFRFSFVVVVIVRNDFSVRSSPVKKLLPTKRRTAVV